MKKLLALLLALALVFGLAACGKKTQDLGDGVQYETVGQGAETDEDEFKIPV